tara:strand:- start:3358 stop:4677 length:1320 start_codon:yes stop_codon:yes gene_type:complete
MGSNSTYKGDSPGKKVSRARLWINAGKLMTALNVPYEGAYVLAGEGGDISTLEALGMPLNSITAVDIDPDYADFCGELYPGVCAVTGEAGKMARHSDYNTAHLDFCNGITLENIETAKNVILGARSLPMMLNITMMKGREAPPRKNYGVNPNLPRHMRQHMLKMSKQNNDCVGTQLIMRGKMFDPALCIARAKNRMLSLWKKAGAFEFTGKNQLGSAVRDGKFTPLGTGMVRMDAFRGCLDILLHEHGITAQITTVLCYHSKSKHSGGTPFVCANFLVARTGDIEFLRKYLYVHAPSLMSFESIPGGESKDALRKFALVASEGFPSKTVAALFDIPAETVIAWRAHKTRGTYGEIDPREKLTKHGKRINFNPGSRDNAVFASGKKIIAKTGIDENGNPTIAPMYSGWGNIVFNPKWEIRDNLDIDESDEGAEDDERKAG